MLFCSLVVLSYLILNNCLSFPATATTPTGGCELSHIEDSNNGTLSTNDQPNECVLHTMNVANNESLTTGLVTAYGPGLSHGQVGKPAEFTIVTNDAGVGMCFIYRS